MKRKLVAVGSALILIPAMAVILALVGLFASYGNADFNTFVSVLIGSDPITLNSPDGEYFLETEVWRRQDRMPEAYLCVLIKIHSDSGPLLQTINTGASDVHRWSVAWEEDSTIRMMSSDIGNLLFRREEDGMWVETQQGGAAAAQSPNKTE